MVTIKQVAAETGVSIATVSRVLNAKDDVGDAVRERVLVACRKLGYRRNEVAASLPRKRRAGLAGRPGRPGRWVQNCVGFLLTGGTERDFLASPFQLHYLNGIQRALQRRSIHTMIASGAEERRAGRLPDMVAQARVDGVIVKPSLDDAEWIRQLAAAVPTVILHESVPGLDVSSARADDAADSRRALQYLHDLGHRRIGFLAVHDVPGWRNYANRQRLHAYADFLAEFGIEPERGWSQMPTRDWARHSLEEVVGTALDRWLAMGERRPTAVYCAADIYALTLMRLARQRGLSIPGDLSVIGCMDIPEAAAGEPALTTIRIAGEEMGRAAVDLLCRQVENPGASVETVMVRGTLVERLSCGPAPEKA